MQILLAADYSFFFFFFFFYRLLIVCFSHVIIVHERRKAQRRDADGGTLKVFERSWREPSSEGWDVSQDGRQIGSSVWNARRPENGLRGTAEASGLREVADLCEAEQATPGCQTCSQWMKR